VKRGDCARVGATLIAVTAVVACLEGRQQPVFRSSVDGVSVSVSVRDGNRAVAGLTAADFELLDNGVRQQIEALSVETQPIDVTLLLDVSRSVEGQRLDQLKRSVVETAQLLRPADRLRLIAVQHELHQVFPFEPGGATPDVTQLQARGGTALFDGLAAALMRNAEPDRRQLIVCYTDGQDTISILDLDSLTKIASFADAVVHIVVPVTTTVRARGASAIVVAAPLGEVAGRTGGQLFTVDFAAPITQAFARAIEEFRTSYVLRYVPAGVKAGGYHELTVRVTSGTYTVRARRGYAGIEQDGGRPILATPARDR
jgi:VWFA-related protein